MKIIFHSICKNAITDCYRRWMGMFLLVFGVLWMGGFVLAATTEEAQDWPRYASELDSSQDSPSDSSAQQALYELSHWELLEESFRQERGNLSKGSTPALTIVPPLRLPAEWSGVRLRFRPEAERGLQQRPHYLQPVRAGPYLI